jgi:hypothetical protein
MGIRTIAQIIAQLTGFAAKGDNNDITKLSALTSLVKKVTATIISVGSLAEKIRIVTAATGTVTLDLATASTFELQMTGNTTVAFTNVPTTVGESIGFTIRIVQPASPFSITWPTSITKWITPTGLAPDTPAANKTGEFIFTAHVASISSGTTITGRKGATN